MFLFVEYIVEQEVWDRRVCIKILSILKKKKKKLLYLLNPDLRRFFLILKSGCSIQFYFCKWETILGEVH